MTSKLMISVMVLGLLTASGAKAQTASETGEKLSQASIIKTLVASGYPAMTSPPPAQLASNPFIGSILTGTNGAKITILLMRCENAAENAAKENAVKDDSICYLSFIATFNDDKRILNDALLSRLNQQTMVAKVTQVARPNGIPALNIIYTLPSKDISDTKFLPFLMTTYGLDITRVAVTYKAAAQMTAH